MKAKIYVCIGLTALIAALTISGCNNNKTPENVPIDNATVDEIVVSSVTEATPATTVARTTASAGTTETTVGETTAAPEPTTEAEEVTEAMEVNYQTSEKVTASNTNKTESKTSVNTQKSYNTNTNNNTNSNTSSNTAKPKPAETKPKETQPPATEAPMVITDDTPLPYDQLMTEETIQRMVDDANAHFANFGMTYNEELDPSWAGWIYGHQGGLSYTDVRSYNETSRRNIEGLQEQIDVILTRNNIKPSEISLCYYKVLYELTDKGTYSIIMCIG